MGLADNLPADYDPLSPESRRSYARRRESGFLKKYLNGEVVLDIGYRGASPNAKPVIPGAIGIELDYPGYDGVRLPFEDGSVDTVYSSHCLEHIPDLRVVLQDHYRVLKVGGYMVHIVPHMQLYEKKLHPPSRFNGSHIHFFTPGRLMSIIEDVLPINGFRVRHLIDNDEGFNYTLGPELHSDGSYEIEVVLQKIQPPSWNLAP